MPDKILNDHLCHHDGKSCDRKGTRDPHPGTTLPVPPLTQAQGNNRSGQIFSREKMFLLLFVLLPLSGAWQLGQGAYIHAKAILAQILLEAAWSDTLKGHQRVKAWPWADTWPVGRLTVPRLGISRIVLAGASGESLAFGPGLFSGLQLTGNEGNIVIAGHRDTNFRFLQDLRRGDVVTLQTPDAKIHDYRISIVRVVDEHDTQYLADNEDSTLTLVTCYPFDAIVPGGPLRYLVIARQFTPGLSRQL